MLLIAVEHVQLGHFAQKMRFLKLNQALCIVNKFILAAEVHEADHLFLLMLQPTALVHHLLHVLEGVLVMGVNLVQI